MEEERRGGGGEEGKGFSMLDWMGRYRLQYILQGRVG